MIDDAEEEALDGFCPEFQLLQSKVVSKESTTLRNYLTFTVPIYELFILCAFRSQGSRGNEL